MAMGKPKKKRKQSVKEWKEEKRRKLDERKKREDQHVVTTAFDSILEIYKTPEEIGEALKSAREKLSELKEKGRAYQVSRDTLDEQYDKIEEELVSLREIVDEAEYPPFDMPSHKFVDHMMCEIRSFAEIAIVPELGQADQAELEDEIEETTRFIKMLDAAKVFADAVAGEQNEKEMR